MSHVAVVARAQHGEDASMIFKGVLDGKPYPDHGLSYRQ